MIPNTPRSRGHEALSLQRRLNAATLGAARWLALAAAPTFASMALLTGFSGEGAAATICSAAHDASPLNGMVLMYLLMSAFHLTPWLNLIAQDGAGSHRPSRATSALEHLVNKRVVCAGAETAFQQRRYGIERRQADDQPDRNAREGAD